MAKKDNTQNAKTGRKNIVGTVLGFTLAAASIAFGAVSIPVFGILTLGVSIIVSGVGAGIGVALGLINIAKYRSKNKTLKLTKQKEEKKEPEKEQTEVASPVEEEQVEEKAERKQTQTPTMQEFLTKEAGPNTFAVYDENGLEILKDADGNEMIYSIAKDNRFRYALNDFSKEFNDLPDCCVKVKDAESKETVHPIKKSTFRKDMTDLLKDIKSVRSKLNASTAEESKQENVEDDETQTLSFN